ncbi:hypothetical protein F4777DRAFT_559532 [Nemania sp. FL0916]|nr:hypothetical protein F4777DRAFT_559532 [Nemania sp. FL0916]
MRKKRAAKMQLLPLLQVALLCVQFSPAACAPTDLTPGSRNLKEYIDNVILDVKLQKYDVIANDYSSTGRSLAFLERDVLPDGCTYDLPTSATTEDQAVAYLRAVKAELNVLGQDAKNGSSANAAIAVCRASDLYGGVAAYVDSVRTDV